MSKWNKVLTNTEIGFEVVSIKAANKADYVVTAVKYPTTEQIYTYVRKRNKINSQEYTTVVDGVEVHYNPYTYEYISATRLYDTKGLKKTTNPGGANKETNAATTSEKIKADMEANDIPAVKVEIKSGEVVRHEQFNTINTCLKANIPVYLVGPAGTGKSSILEQIAEENNWDFYSSNSIQQEYKLTGFIDAGGKYHETEFYKACTSEKECIFFLDEMDASIPEVLVILNTAIANGYFEFPNGKVKFDKVHWVAAGNTTGNGADEQYTGRMVLDQATLDRFVIIDVDYSLRIEMAITNGNSDLVGFIHELRKQAAENGIRATFSYRCMIAAVKLIKAGMDLTTILKIAIFKGMDKDTIAMFNPTCSDEYSTAMYNLKKAA